IINTKDQQQKLFTTHTSSSPRHQLQHTPNAVFNSKTSATTYPIALSSSPRH
ncbi:hypothetical protein Bpfe_016954, partial [Biomphalaria pfeifferi]